jgi:alpha-tubulin suppressor-like RCC1 family protein
MTSGGKVRSSFTLLALLATAVACGRTGLILLDDDEGPPPVADAGLEGGAGADAEGGVLPDSLDADLILVGDAAVANDQQIATGEAHACLRTTKGEVFCWGANELGQVGDGTQIHQPIAKKVEGLPSIVRVAAGTHHTCALAVDETIWCWGGNTQGEQGQGVMGPDPVFKPTKVPVPGAIGISAGGYHTCAHDAQGKLYCWGRNIYGEAGAQGEAYVLDPKPVPGLGNVIEVAAGWDHTCAIMADAERTMQCWGRNQDGQIGNGLSGSTEIDPQVAIGVSHARAAFAGDDHTCALLVDGTMQCWGDNENGELGAGAALYSDKALKVVGMTDAYQGGGGREHSCVASSTGNVFCWGANTGCALGFGQPCGVGAGIAKVPTQVAGLNDARWVATGEVFSCAAHREHGAMCWGQNDRGQLGSGTMNDFGEKPGLPTEVQGL